MSHWSSFMDKIDKAYKELKLTKNQECFYRGHGDTTWGLSPSLLRDSKDQRMERYPVVNEEGWYTEANLYYEFRSRARELEVNLTDWDVLFHMQHHGVRTRLLDWTESFGVALYFALSGYTPGGEKACIWMMNPYRYNYEFKHGGDLWEPERLDFYKEGGEEEAGEEQSYSDLLLGNWQEEIGEMFRWETPVALYPARRNSRLTAQSGYFTIHGNNVAPLEQICKNKTILIKVEIPHQAVKGGFDFLRLAGIHHFSMYPDLQGLAMYLNQKYF